MRASKLFASMADDTATMTRQDLILALRDTGDIESRSLASNRELLAALDLNTSIVPGVDRPARVFYRRVHGARTVVDAGAAHLLDMTRYCMLPGCCCCLRVH